MSSAGPASSPLGEHVVHSFHLFIPEEKAKVERKSESEEDEDRKHTPGADSDSTGGEIRELGRLGAFYSTLTALDIRGTH